MRIIVQQYTDLSADTTEVSVYFCLMPAFSPNLSNFQYSHRRLI